MDLMLKNKVVLITGGAAGIGKATAFACAREGATVVIADILYEEGKKVTHKIEEMGKKSIFATTDVSQDGDVKQLIRQIVEMYGKLDCAVNNAGTEGEQATTALTSEQNWDKVTGVNLKGTWLCMKYEIEQMLKQNGGSIVNMSSVAGVIGFEGICAYSASKHGVIGLTKTAALEYAKSGIRVNAVCPGIIETDMVKRFVGDDPEAAASFVSNEPVGRMGKPEEVAEAVIWLCSDSSSFVTGESMIIDGGMTAR
ncbi:MAG: SDR family oxidoreductase [Chitinivibrionales bacterium]|nr:SDR family oxidoreductase [Chitinivibrionales bacterium]